MVREWISVQLHSVVNTLQVFGGKEEKFYAPSSHINELREMDDRLRLEAQQLSRDYTYTDNDYFD